MEGELQAELRKMFAEVPDLEAQRQLFSFPPEKKKRKKMGKKERSASAAATVEVVENEGEGAAAPTATETAKRPRKKAMKSSALSAEPRTAEKTSEHRPIPPRQAPQAGETNTKTKSADIKRPPLDGEKPAQAESAEKRFSAAQPAAGGATSTVSGLLASLKARASTSTTTSGATTAAANPNKKKLVSARFRELNEELYTSSGKTALHWFKSQPHLFDAYHAGFSEQVKKWPSNPVDVLVKFLKAKFELGSAEEAAAEDSGSPMDVGGEEATPKTEGDTVASTRRELVIADLGCGEAKVAQALEGLRALPRADEPEQKESNRLACSHMNSIATSTPRPVRVHNFDLVGKKVANEKQPSKPDITIQPANINQHVPLTSSSVDVVVLCLALMGTDCFQALKEAARILKPKGLLLIAEVRSRFVGSGLSSVGVGSSTSEGVLDLEGAERAHLKEHFSKEALRKAQRGGGRKKEGETSASEDGVLLSFVTDVEQKAGFKRMKPREQKRLEGCGAEGNSHFFVRGFYKCAGEGAACGGEGAQPLSAGKGGKGKGKKGKAGKTEGGARGDGEGGSAGKGGETDSSRDHRGAKGKQGKGKGGSGSKGKKGGSSSNKGGAGKGGVRKEGTSGESWTTAPKPCIYKRR
eukprot:g2334.t1